MKLILLSSSITALTDDDDSLSGMYQCVSELPQANRETLAAIIIHLQKVANSTDTQMSVSNLAKVFGPTLIGHRSSNPSHMEMLDDTKAQPVVNYLLHFLTSSFCWMFMNEKNLKRTDLAEI